MWAKIYLLIPITCEYPARSMKKMFHKTTDYVKLWDILLIGTMAEEMLVSYTRVSETSAGCLRSIYPSVGMIQLFGDVTMGQWRHN